jgi:hypothetical protein
VSGKSRTFRGLLRLLIAEGWDVEQLLRSAIRLSSAGNMLTSAAVSSHQRAWRLLRNGPPPCGLYQHSLPQSGASGVMRFAWRVARP